MKKIFKKKVSVVNIDSNIVCLLYTVDRVSNRPIDASIYPLIYYPIILIYSILFRFL